MTFNVQLISYFILLHVNLLQKCDNKPQNVCLVVFPMYLTLSMRVTHPSPLRTAYLSILASRTAYRFTTKTIVFAVSVYIKR